ncbi:MAG: hypothetical protein PF489_01655, partial [Salinivirgaceae bacterium]|nr:hypothetical protein [Salinivirgaceae bacterium]
MKRIRIAIVSMIILIFLRDFIVKIIDNVIVNPILSEIESSLFNDILFVGIFFWILYIIGANCKKMVTTDVYQVLLSTWLIIVIINYRFISDHWEFTKTTLIDFIAYLDILIPILTIEILKFFLPKKNQEDIDEGKRFYNDNPIHSDKEDKLERQTLAASIAEHILNTRIDKRAFSIGIYGEWGS